MASGSNQAFEALADPTRRTILSLLATRGESPAGEIAEVVAEVSRTGVSSHLRVLRSAGLVVERRQGRFRLYSLNPGAIDEVMEFLTGLYRTSLEQLKAQAEGSSTDGRAKRHGQRRSG